jgi:hypothetical protein
MRAVLLILLLLACAAPALAQSDSPAGEETDVVITTSPLVPVSGLSLEVTATFLSGGIDAATLFVRPTATTEAFTEFPGTRNPQNPQQFSATIPGSLLTLRGFEAYVIYVQDGETKSVPTDNPQGNPMRFPTLTPRVRAELVLNPRQYRIVSIPQQFVPELGGSGGTLDEVFADDFGPYDPDFWRIFRWDPTIEAYREGAQAVPRVEPGEAFWLITASGGDFDVEGGVTPGFELEGSIPTMGPTRVTLQPGFNQVGNPFAFPMPWDAVVNSGAVSEPFAFEGSAGYRPGVQTLAPWTGYFVFNPTAGPVQLAFNPPVAPAARPAEAPFAERLLTRLAADYLLQLRAAGGDQEDAHTYLAVGPAGAALSKPPPIADGLSVHAVDAGRPHAVSVRQPGEAPVWTVAVRGAWAQPRSVTVDVEVHGRLPAGTGVAVRDAASGEALPSPGGRVELSLGGATSEVLLEIALLPIDELPAPPLAARLAAPHPNPLAPSAGALRVSFWSASGEEARLELFDVLGRRVAVLTDGPAAADGWQEIAWHARDAAGRVLPAGTYVLRLTSGEGRAARTITIVR